MIDYLAVTGHPPADERPRRPTPCEDCGSREVETVRVTRFALPLPGEPSQDFPMIVCAGCGGERLDLEHDAPLTEDYPSGWEVWNGEAWELEIPYTHSDPPPMQP